MGSSRAPRRATTPTPRPADGCSAACAVEIGFTCVGVPSVCLTTCGDGIRAGSETCDDGDVTAGDGCDAACQTEAGYACSRRAQRLRRRCAATGSSCPAEKCDDGNNTSGDGCSATCQVEPGFELETNNTLATANDFQALAVAGKINGNIKPAGDKDYYFFVVPPAAPA